jgi:ketosteroid isomerase-like protein
MTARVEEVLAAEERFFNALLEADGEALRAVLTPDFVLIDVMTGSEIAGPALVDVVGSGQLRFEAIERLDSRVRRYGSAAVVTGRTRMRGRFGGEPFGAHSRYTHVYVRDEGRWRLASAQGTPVAESLTAEASGQ